MARLAVIDVIDESGARGRFVNTEDPDATCAEWSVAAPPTWDAGDVAAVKREVAACWEADGYLTADEYAATRG